MLKNEQVGGKIWKRGKNGLVREKYLWKSEKNLADSRGGQHSFMERRELGLSTHRL
jgi:hypothetical protein